MDTDKLPIKFSEPREIDELRIEGSGVLKSLNGFWRLESFALTQEFYKS